MLASELIKELEYFIKKYGDTRVIQDRGGDDVVGAYYGTDGDGNDVLVVE